jgi:cytochrome c biogenesis protein CcmG, thiol:disulfide interchange protein DsbE
MDGRGAPLVDRRHDGSVAVRLTLAAAVLVASLSIAACSGEPLPGSVGAAAPAYSAVTLDGDSVALAGLRGDVVLLNMWATWCHPCREEIPVLQRLHERLAPRGLRVVGVSVDAGSDGERVGAFAREFGMTYPIWLDPNERVAETFHTLGVPTTLLIDRAGVVRWRHTGPVKETDPALSRALEEALAPGPATS